MGASYSVDEFIKALDINYILDSYMVKDNMVIFQIQSNVQEVECPYCGKKTIRLEKNILYTATNVSSVNASKVLKAGNISVSKSSIYEMLKKNTCCCG